MRWRPNTLTPTRIFAVKEELEKAQARRLQPHFIKSFFDEAFKQLGGSLKGREPERWEITHVPSSVRERDRMVGSGAPVMTRYERVCFQKDRIRLPGKPQVASFICPGHPLVLVDGEAVEGPYYVEEVFNQALDFGVTSVNYDIKKLLAAASVPKIFQV